MFFFHYGETQTQFRAINFQHYLKQQEGRKHINNKSDISGLVKRILLKKAVLRERFQSSATL